MIIIDTLIGFLKDFGNNVFPLMFSLIFFCGLSYMLGWWRGYDSGHRAGYEDGRTYGYNFRELELQQERVRIRLQEEKTEPRHPLGRSDRTGPEREAAKGNRPARTNVNRGLVRK